MKKIIAVIMACTLIIVSVSGCADWERFKKSWDSNMSNGLDREVIVYSATGEEIWRYEGKCDISYADGRVLFDDENGKRHSVYNGMVIVNEV